MSDLLSAAKASADDAETWTRREILQQPETLRGTYALLMQQRQPIEAFLAPLLAKPDLRIILAGAGTSAFIGECLAMSLARRTGRRVEAVATTDIVSAPDLYLEADTPTLLVSFGRSGNSPESVAAVELVDARVTDRQHLIITCNADGALAGRRGDDAHVIVLPEATHDRAFAMTSSFSAMMLTALAAFSGIEAFAERVRAIADAVAQMTAEVEQPMAALAARSFSRVVYLGSGPFRGLAREAALKLLELTDGRVVTLFDSTLGFRHGPKTVVNAETLIVVFVSNDPLTRAYDRDMIDELRADGVAGTVLAVSAQDEGKDTISVSGLADTGDVDLLFPYIVPAQLFALQASFNLGLTPDTPNATGTVNRVVQGVRIHSSQS
ncbi:SIS domain-containing protein [Stakelama sediminis]|uniref:Tagatose-6-phosphate ketose/aldose isomerase n=1 Tax=Stakelama sediminis TaxID=463200 RepID=A0A840YZQ4_9SPHN|nr:SIS domain-containing protein [Stakelama sediminis]MBB5719188.1 tagatose-6-phosphate ketose/aldose isomerase [Stakelama sediminis]